MKKVSGGIFGLIVIVLLGMLVIGQQPKDTTLVEVQEEPAAGEDLRRCKQDQDCISVVADCCDCDQGGRRVAINRKFFSHWNEEKSDACFFAGCKPAESTHQSCTTGKPSCVNNQCQMQ